MCMTWMIERDQWMIERLREAMGAALVGNNFSPIPSKIRFTWKKNSDSSRPEIYKLWKPFWLLNWVSIAGVVACFPQASRSRPAATAADSEMPCVCARPSDPRKQSRRAAPTWRACLWILFSQPWITFWYSLRRYCQMTGRGTWPTTCKGFISPEITA